MGKAGYKKFLKKERSKVKLKGTKTLLPKGQNVTKTDFKTKKIVIRDQLKQHGEDELLTRKKLNVQELLSRLEHHNVGAKQDALEGLKELSLNHPGLAATDSAIVDRVAKMTLDQIHSVRKEANKLLGQLLEQVSEEQVSPLFPSLISYLCCGLTHIDRATREDSLFFLDVLLNRSPSLCAKHSPKLLPICLDLVSQSASGSRSLSLHLDSKLTAEKWRGQVLARIRTLLSASAKLRIAPNERSERIILVTNATSPYIPMYFPQNLKCPQLNLNQNHNSEKTVEEFDWDNFAEALVPLLMDIFLEAASLEDLKESKDVENATVIPMETAALLLCISETLLSLFQILQSSDSSVQYATWFHQKFAKSILNRLVRQRFPYSVHSNAEERNRKKKETVSILNALQVEQMDKMCFYLNLIISKLALLFSKDHTLIISYLKRCLRSADKLTDVECRLLVDCMKTVSIENQEAGQYFIELSATYSDKEGNIASYLFSFLADIALNQNLTSLQEEPAFIKWLGKLPTKLTKRSISLHVLDAIVKISTRSFKSFSESLDSYIEAILDNIPKLHVEAGKDDDKMKIAGLLFTVKDWDEEVIVNIVKGIEHQYWGEKITQYLIDILRALKFQRAAVSFRKAKKQMRQHEFGVEFFSTIL